MLLALYGFFNFPNERIGENFGTNYQRYQKRIHLESGRPAVAGHEVPARQAR